MKKKMINAVTSSHSEPICKTTTVSVKENENNTSVDSETNVEVETSVTTDAVVAVVTVVAVVAVENAEPPVVEKKKERKKKTY